MAIGERNRMKKTQQFGKSLFRNILKKSLWTEISYSISSEYMESWITSGLISRPTYQDFKT